MHDQLISLKNKHPSFSYHHSSSSPCLSHRPKFFVGGDGGVRATLGWASIPIVIFSHSISRTSLQFLSRVTLTGCSFNSFDSEVHHHTRRGFRSSLTQAISDRIYMYSPTTFSGQPNTRNQALVTCHALSFAASTSTPLFSGLVQRIPTEHLRGKTRTQYPECSKSGR